jgi:Eukaryotic cytochrome b561
LGVGYLAATRPNGRWRNPFSWHPFLMTVGMVGCMGCAAVTKKMGGYQNTKAHGILASLGYVLALAGLYAIYHNKELFGRPHFTTLHGKGGLVVLLLTIPPLMVGGVFLHPDWGLDRSNQDYRKAHKSISRILLGCAWGTALYGMYGMTKDPVELLIYGGPLVVLAPFTLV